ncbi:endolytic transglycosylase MltG [Corynebacterium aquilae]|uniref:Endolytic murein transglycosylase n=1 Tax=Corynebacterium aquilae DSM 44791 TaxID=1431546 RepID=A0A1L7CGA6_9CORY|nr:endolytic transglycosylase MltG [Corynebacterium aquilae]APT84855.1 ABC transporter substrate-binding protein [Corynebacterium aquilae DSM 44791]
MESTYVKRRQRGLAVLIVTLLLIIGSVVYIAIERNNMKTPADYTTTGNGQVELVEIKPGSSVSELGPELVERDIVKSNGAFQKAAGANPNAAKVQPGIYRLQGEMSAESAVEALLNPANKVQTLDIPGGATLNDVVVVGGKTRPGIFSQISQVTCAEGASNCLTVAALKQAAGGVDPVELGVPEWAVDAVRARGNDPRRIEGLIMPGEYVVNPEQNAAEVLRSLITASAEKENETNIVGRAQAVGLTPYELLIAASLVERESPAGDFPKVARVILNRLQEPMRLEFDSTVNYDLPNQEVATTDEDRARVTPWNTYAKDGLPETPIASPSLEAIEAMENPADGDWLFFVTIDKDGTTVFNRTFDEHQRATQESIENGVLDSQR